MMLKKENFENFEDNYRLIDGKIVENEDNVGKVLSVD